MVFNTHEANGSKSPGLKDLEPCVFPAFDIGEKDCTDFLTIKSHLHNLELQDHTDINSALCTAWGILLSCFTGLDTVCFGYNKQVSADSVNSSSLPLAAVRQVIQLHVGGDRKVHKAFDECNPRTLPSARTTDTLNTALMLGQLESHAANHDDHSASSLGHNPFPDLKIIVAVDPRTLRTEFSWVGSFMTVDQARNINGTFEKILSEVVTKPGDSISRLDIFSQRNLRKVLAWNSTPLSDVRKCIHHAITEQAVARPDAEAICAWDGSFSYRELTTLSDQLALSLQAAGVTLESFVPICFDKSKWTVVAMLAVLKSGGIFVPLDPTHPVPRLQALAHKVGGQTLLCSRHHLEKLATVAPTLIPVDEQLFTHLPDAATDKHSGNAVSYMSGAYMIFTSGTTGEPKGALIQHGALLSSAMAHGPAMMMDHNTRSLQFAASTFDVSITEILSCLILGGCVCIPSEEARLNAIEEAITELQANWALLTPTFVKFINPDHVPSLKTLVTGGEAMTQAIIRSWSHINLINCYGPAETSVVSHVHRGMREGKNPLNIGRQVGIHCWVVDRNDHNRLMPVGAVGELVIESHTLAREYYKEPEKTADVFISDPEWARSLPKAARPRRMYKTGDLVKYNHDGTFHIAGRKDTQIKFHGQRIELGEIEHHLNVSPSIKHGMVVLPQEGFCKGRLLAIVQLSDALNQDLVPKGRPYQLIQGELEETAKEKVGEAKQLLTERLPPYMIPSMWISVEFIPRLQSGKLDRKQTAQWVNNMSETLYRQLNPNVLTSGAREDMTLASELEKKLHKIWSHVLNLKPEQLGLRQSFLSVGGDSISAMQVMSECRKIGIGLTVRHIIGAKSIAELALHVKDIETPLFHREVLEHPFDLSPIQKLYFSRPDFDKGHYNQSFLLRTSRRILSSELRAAIEVVIQRHSMLRARFSRDGAGSWQQRITNDVAPSYRLRTITLPARDAIDESLADSQTCLNATEGPLFAADLIDVNGEEELLFVVAHHLVIDLVSWRVILQELEEILTHPGSVSATERPLPFQVWCKLQSDHASSLAPDQVLPIQGIPDGNAEYWGMVDKPNVYGQMTQETFEIDSSLTSLLLSKCHESLRTEIPDVLLAAMIFSFGQTFTDRPVPAVFAEGHGREVWDSSIDLSDVVGWFTTIYPVFAGSTPHIGLVDAAKAVKDGRRKVPSSGRPYFASRWLTKQGSDAFSRHWPLEITFNYLGQYQQLEREGALFTPARDIAGEVRGATDGADVGPQTTCISLFEVSAVILKGCLRFSFVFNRNMEHQDSIRRWISTCQQSLGDMIQELSVRPKEVTLSDFPLLDLTYDRLDVMMHEKLHASGVTALDEVEDAYPCSPMQSGLLVSTARNDAFYAAYTLHEVKSRSNVPVDVRKLAAAWSQLVEYHSILRTVFVESVSQEDSLYDQVVLRHTKAAPVQSKARSAEDARALLSSSPQHQQSTAQPLHHFEICQTDDGRVFCRLDISHVIMDGTSMSILFRDLTRAYDGTLRTREAPLYRNYIAHLASQPKEPGLTYWTKYLSGVEPCHFPVLDDAIPTAAKQLRYVRVKFDELTELQELCDQQGVTIVNAIYAAWALTLRLYTASEEVCFGYLTSSRDLPIDGIRDVVGPVINMVACRLNMTSSSTLGEVMATVQKDYLDSLAFRHISLSEVQHALKLVNTPLFNTALSYRKLPRGDEDPSEITLEECRPTYDPDEYNVSINIEADEKDMAVDLMYWTDTLSDGQAHNVASTFTKALMNILRNCDTPLAQLDHLGHWHHEQLDVWNRSMPTPVESCLHGLIEKEALRRPNAPALASWDLNFTYAELDDASTRLAKHIASLGVQLESFVLLCFDKSAVTIVAMIAVLKAGGVCVPLDPAHPDAALQLRAEDTKASMALVSPSQAQRFQSLVKQTIVVDRELLEGLSTSQDLLLPRVEPSNACFIIYTSGSTGRPKGVVLEHRGIATNAACTGPLLGYEEDSRVLQFASYTFDNSLAEIFTTLTRGGCVCVPSDHERLNDLTGVINRLQVTVADITPTVACFLQPSDVPTLKTLALGGEAVTVKCVDIWRDHVALKCCYGPSECSVNSTYSGDIAEPGRATNIGRAAGCVVWVVDADDHNCLLPLGCTGELLIDGPIVSRGYLNLPEKTKQSFISPLSWSHNVLDCSDTNKRLYKTGDLVRYESDGTLVYLGRKDTQVKLRGQRIELGEIESNIEQLLPAGAQTAVELVVLDGKKSLACFLCTDSDGLVPSSEDESNILAVTETFRAQAKELEIQLSNKLPSYMVPTMWLPVSQMPLTASGKLNRRGLRSQAEGVPASLRSSYKLATKSGRAPTREFELKLTEVWATVLNIDKSSIGVEDNFFKLGGDSLGAMRLVTLARKHDISLTVGSIFQKATLLQMAETARPMLKASEHVTQPFSLIPNGTSVDTLKRDLSTIVGTQPEKIQDIYPCTAIQEGLMALSIREPGAYVAQLVYRLPEDLDVDKFMRAWDVVTKAEPVLRTRILHTEAHGFLQVVVDDAIDWQSVTSLGGVKESDRRLPQHNGAALANYTIVGPGSRTPYFVWTIHHALYDGWCLPIILDKVRGCYEASAFNLLSGPSYASFIQYVSGLSSKDTDKFWMSQLSDMSAQHFPRLPRPDYQASASSLIVHTTPLARHSGSDITVATRIRAAWALTNAAYSGADDVVFWETVTGRDAPVPGIEEMIGATLATVPSRHLVNTSLTAKEFLSKVQDQSAAAMPHQYAGIQRIKRLSDDAAMACEAQNLIAINHGKRDSQDSFWEEQTDEMAGTNFYTYPLMLSCHIGESDLETVVHFDDRVVPEWQMHRIMDHFGCMLESLSSLQLSNEALCEIDSLSVNDMETIRKWNGTMPHRIDDTVHGMIKRQGTAQGQDKCAVSAWDGELTYEAMHTLASRLASQLQELGVAPGAIVPFCLEKSSLVPVSMLAILQCGAAFVPLDPAHPDTRIGGILEDVNAGVVLCSPAYSERFSCFGRQPLIVSLESLEKLTQAAYAEPSVLSTSPAYVIFTSGTTGKPKGTIVSHGAFCTGAVAHGSAMGMDESSRVLQFASHTFDASIMETLTTLVHGGTVCVPSDEERMNDITGAINRMQVNWTLLTPSVAQLMVPSLVPGLKTLVLGGEAMSTAHINTWASANVRLMNAYGPSETAVVAAVNSRVSLASGPSNIGHAVGGLCWVVDARNHNKLVPIGAVGELVVEGPIVAEGYLNNTRKTEEAFIVNPTWCDQFIANDSETGRRMYKTGDLVKLAQDGTIIFQGRKDNQVKINGQRLELSEVEHHLSTDAAIQYGLALLPSSGRCQKRLTAVMTLKSVADVRCNASDSEIQLVEKATTASYLSGIRERVASHLAAYMVPSRWIVIDHFPLQPSGKLDRRRVVDWVEALDDDMYQKILDIEENAAGLDREPTDLEHKLRAAWAKVLNLDVLKIPFNQSFLHLGGDSISSMQLMSVCRASNIALTVAHIMQSKSIVDLATRATEVQDVVFEAEKEGEAFELSPIQRVYFDCMGADSTHFNQSIIVTTTRRISVEQLSTSLESLIQHHSMLRSRFAKTDGRWSQSITSDITGSYTLSSHARVPREQLPELIQRSQESLDIQIGPLVAADLFEMADSDNQILFIAAHHLVVDVVSWQIILSDLEQLLSSNRRELARSLPFQIWSGLQLQEARKKSREQVFHSIPLPPRNVSYWGMQGVDNCHRDAVVEKLEIGTHQSLLLLGACHVPFETDAVDVMLASLLFSFAQTFKDRKSVPAVYNEGHGREPWSNKIDISRTVGWFTTLCPVYLPESLPSSADIVEIVRWIKDFRRKAPGKGRPYFAHRILADGERDELSQWPLEIAFNYLGQVQQGHQEDSTFKTMNGGVMDAINSQTDIGEEVPRLALIEVTASVTAGTFNFEFSFNRHMHRQDGIRDWITGFGQTLQQAVQALCKAVPEPTMAEFPLLPVTFNGIELMKSKLSQVGVASLEDVEDAYPCSPVQEGILLTQLKDPEHYAYSITFEIRSNDANEPINVQRLVHAWQKVVDRHSTLRTVFVGSLTQDEGMHQVVLHKWPANVASYQCTDNEMFLRLNSQHALGLPESQPPHRLRVCQIPEGRVVCVLEMSHAISDGTSMPILFRDLALAYDDNLSRARLAVYKEYISYSMSISQAEAAAYWKQYLKDIEPCHFPADGISQGRTRVLRSYDQTISCAGKLNNFCNESGTTLSNMLQLAWALVLQAYTGLDEVCFGYLVSGRDVPVEDIGNSIGVFINMLVFRAHLEPTFTLGDIIQSVQADLLRSMQHKEASLADMQHNSSISNGPLFNTAYSFQRRSVSKDMAAGSLSFDIQDAADPSEYDITVNVEVWDSNAELQLCYWSDKVSEERIKHVASTFDQVLTSMVSSGPNVRIGELEIISDGCKKQINTWNLAEPEYMERCIHHVFEDNARLQSETTQAIDAWDAAFSYRDLHRITDRLAAYLASQGVRPGTYVPLCFEKSAWTVVAMLAVLKAGGAFVPLDPAHPAERTSFLVHSTEATIALCSETLASKLDHLDVPIFQVSKGSVSQLPDSLGLLAQAQSAAPTDPAYIIFTSGTTGLPKGTIIEHGAFTTGGIAHAKAIHMTSTSRVLQFASHTFDASIMEILSTLLVGGCICIPHEQDRLNDLSAVINKFDINWALLTPSVANVLRPGTVPSLKTLVTGGEAMAKDHINKWGSSAVLVNAYGPSETSVIATTSTKVNRTGEVLDSDPATIGRAVGSRCWVVDPRNHNRLMPLGSIGELVVEGPIVARGYLNNETKTRDAFIEHPPWRKNVQLAGHRQDRMYKTGDLVVYNSDGSLRYIARKDTQIKLNGQRIELGEIEHHVKINMPANSQSTVELVVPQSTISTKALAIFFTHEEETESKELLLPMSPSLMQSCQSLKAALANALPSYMVPTIYIPVTKMPWTTAGKLDRQKLRSLVGTISMQALGPYKLASATQGLKPLTPAQRKLRNAWQRVLKVEADAINREDNFFRLGGDSVGAMKLVAAAKLEDVVLTVMNVFKHPTLSDMANFCSETTKTSIDTVPRMALLRDVKDRQALLFELAQRCGVTEDQIQDAYPCSSLQEGLMSSSLQQPGAYVAENVFKLPRSVDLDRFKRAVQKTTECVEILRSRIVYASDSMSYQVILEPREIEWKFYNTAVHHATGASATVPGRNGGHLALYTIVQEPESSNVYFVWTIHHALYDAWSMPSILRLISQCYHSISELELSIERPPFANFIKYLADVDSTASDAFWTSKFAGASPSHFPVVSNLTTQAEGRSSQLQHVVPYDLSGVNLEVTMSTVVRAAWSLVLSSQTGSDDVVFGETLSGRDIALQGVGDILGPTLTTVPQRFSLDRDLTVKQLLKSVHQKSSEVIPYQHAGLQNIRRLDKTTEIACDFANLLVIQVGETVETSEDQLMTLEEGTAGDERNFFTYPLVVECALEAHELRLTVHHNDNILSTWQVQRITHQFEALLQQLLRESDNSTQDLKALRFCSPEDVQILTEWNKPLPQSVEESIASLFMDVAVAQPRSVAIEAWDGCLTYAELKSHASNLATVLVQTGVKAEILVPCCLDKSLWSSVAMLAVILAGGAIVPLDPMHPPARHAEIAKECDATVVLCSPAHRSRFSHFVDHLIVVDDALFTDLLAQSQPTSHDLNLASSRDAALVIYTSGSTGKPKGVVIDHRSFCTSSRAFMKRMNLTPASRVFNFTSYAFDIAMGETFGAFSIGACLCVPSEEMRTSDLPGAMNSLKADWVFLTPSVANIQDPSQFTTLKTLVCGGEALTPETIQKWADKVALMNGYGPSECTIFCVANAHVGKERDHSQIGQYMEGGRTWVVDPKNHNDLVPIGCVGELLIDGPIVSRGYLKQEAKTADAFITNPTWASLFTEDDIRLYKTGDLVKYRPDGTLTFVGRKDYQVKLHGQRMELGDIEANLETDSRIRHALVALPQSGICKGRLVAVISLHGVVSEDSSVGTMDLVKLSTPQLQAARPEVLAVQDRLSGVLPSYMVPTEWLVVGTLPFLVSGKLNRHGVQSWLNTMDMKTYLTSVSKDAEGLASQPATPEEEFLRHIVSLTLNLEEADTPLDRSFISLGGDSITAMQIMTRCRDRGIRLKLQDIIRGKSIKVLAAACHLEDASESNQKTIFEERHNESFPLSPIQQLFFENSVNKSEGDRFNQSQLLQVTEKIDSQVFNTAINALVEKHSMLRARFAKDIDGRWTQLISEDVESSYGAHVHSITQDSDMSPLIARSQKSISINGPLFIADLFEKTCGGQIISLVGHHLVVDIVSWSIIFQDLEGLLKQSRNSPTKPLPFQSWNAAQIEQAKGLEAQGQPILPFDLKAVDLGFWGMESTFNLYGDTNEASFVVSSNAINAITSGEMQSPLGTDPLDMLTSAILQSFALTFTERDLPTIFNEGHGREPWNDSLDISQTVGWFTVLNPVQIPLDDPEDTIDFLRKVKDTRRSVPNNGRPYFARRYLTNSGRQQYPKNEPMELIVNFLGRVHNKRKAASSLLESYDYEKSKDEAEMISDVAPDTHRLALFEISISLHEDGVHFSFLYNKQMRHLDRVSKWISQCQQVLLDTAQQLMIAPKTLTLSDLPLLPVNYEDLHKLNSKVLPAANLTGLDQVEDIYPCSPMQTGMLLSQVQDTGRYLFHTVLEVTGSKGPVDLQRFSSACAQVVLRHPSLRTVFVNSVYRGGTFDQVILRPVAPRIEVIKCKEIQVMAKLNSKSLEKTNNGLGPKLPYQITICGTPNGKVFMKLEMNHAITDGTSTSLIMQEIGKAYTGTLPTEEPATYKKYIEYISRQRLDNSLNFWITYLSGASTTNFPTLRQHRDVERNLNSVTVSFDRYAQLNSLSTESGVTMSSIILAAWGLVLRSYTESEDVCFGYLASGRDAPIEGIDEIVGPLINMLVFRFQFVPGMLLKNLFFDAQEDYLASLPHQHVSLAHVNHALGRKNKQLFNTAVSIQNSGYSSSSEEEPLLYESIEAHDPSEFAITMNVNTARDDEGILLRYWSDVLSETDGETLASTLADLLDDFVDHCDEALSHLRLFKGTRMAIHTPRTPNTVNSWSSQGKENSPNAALTSIPTSESSFTTNPMNNSMNKKLEASSHVRNLLADKLMWVWTETLGLEAAAVLHESSFFELGGDSIIAMSMVANAREANLSVNVADVFRHPTFSEMLAHVLEKSAAEYEPSSSDDETYFSKKDSEQSRPEQYQPFSLLECDDTEAFIRGIVCPATRVSRASIVDVLPATDFQAQAVAGHQLNSRWMLNHFYLDGEGPLDLELLRESLMNVVATFDILRTVFVQQNGCTWQVVLRHVSPQVEAHSVADIDEFTSKLEVEHQASVPDISRPVIRLTVVHHNSTARHRIFLRISHAQYDGVCFPAILDALKSSYEGMPIAPSLSYAHFVHGALGRITSEHYDYWTKLLKGSSMSPVVPRDRTVLQTVPTKVLKHTVNVRSLASFNITTATIIKASWAVTMARITGLSDVVFGHLISGRNVDNVQEIEGIVGPCLNIVPVRVSLDPTDTAMQLLHKTQNQQIENMAFESLGFREIIEKCTGWENVAGLGGFATMVQHQSMRQTHSLSIGGNKYDVGALASQQDTTDFSVVTTPLGNDEVEVCLIFADDGQISEDLANETFAILCEEIERMAREPERRVVLS